MRLFAAFALVGAALAAAAASAAPPATLSLTATPTVLAYGAKTTLSGVLSTQKANQTITIQAQECGKTIFANAGNAKAAANGAYSMALVPTGLTVYQAKWKSTTSGKVTIEVSPLVQLARVAAGSFTAKVTAGLDLKGKWVLFQRFSKLRKRWVQVKKVVLSTSAPGTAKPTVISSAAFKAKVARRTRLRLLLSKSQAAPCYLSASSNIVRG